MRFVLGLILLAFPFAEIFLLVNLSHRYGWWLLLYLVVVGVLGLQLIKGEKLLMSAKMMQSLSAGGNPIKTMLGSARNMVAGVLLMIPGVISDIIAVILLLIPISKQSSKPNPTGTTNTQQPYERTKAANDDVIEGEYTHVNEDNDKK
jgi:UPF0716 protein FxsA